MSVFGVKEMDVNLLSGWNRVRESGVQEGIRLQYLREHGASLLLDGLKLILMLHVNRAGNL